MWTWILGAILSLLILLLLLPLTTIVKVNWDRENHGLLVEFIPGFKVLRLKKVWSLEDIKQIRADSLAKKAEDTVTVRSAAGDKRIGVLWLWYWWNSRAARRGLKRIHLRKLVWETSFSTGDVALTGVVTGALWAVKGWLLAFVGNLFQLDAAHIQVWPRWDNRIIETRVDCIVKTRLVHIIGIGITAAWYFIRYQWLAK